MKQALATTRKFSSGHTHSPFGLSWRARNNCRIAFLTCFTDGQVRPTSATTIEVVPKLPEGEATVLLNLASDAGSILEARHQPKAAKVETLLVK